MIAAELLVNTAITRSLIRRFVARPHPEHVARIAVAEGCPAGRIESIGIENLAPDIDVTWHFQRFVTVQLLRQDLPRIEGRELHRCARLQGSGRKTRRSYRKMLSFPVDIQ